MSRHITHAEGLRYEVDDGVAVITIDRPDKNNALTPRMQLGFRDIWADVRDDQDIRAAVVIAAGDRFFSAGFDLDGVQGEDSTLALNNRPLPEAVFWSPHQNRVMKPVICLVNGLVTGAGLHFVVDADIIVASKNAVFLDTHVNVGMVGALENIGLAKRLPLGTALRMTLQGRDFRLSADRAFQLGLVDELVDSPDELLEAGMAIARSIAGHSPQAVQLSKEAVWGSLDVGYRDALEKGWALVRLHWGHPDFQEGPAAFGDRREPQWDSDPNAGRGDAAGQRDQDRRGSDPSEG